MLDAHCHIDLYPNPTRVAIDAERAGVFTVLVTNLPSAFEAAYPNIRPFKKIRLALGLHPLNAPLHTDKERQLFQVLVNQTSFIGEIGLDFSPAGYQTRDAQIASFQFALRSLNRIPKFVTVHSRRAEMAVLDLARQEYGMPIILHWYTGTNKIVDLALDAGHYFSVNPAMVESKRSRSIVQRIPRERVLTESDGPFVRVGTRVVVPADVQRVENALAAMWNIDGVEVRNIIDVNFRRLVEPIRSGSLLLPALRP
jgi:TatD DNase family protein